MSLRLSPEQTQYWGDELKKCRDSFKYFANTYCYVNLPDKEGKRTSGVVKITLFDYQEQAAQELDDHQLVIFKKPRQMGISVLIALYLLWVALFRFDKVILVLSINGAKAEEFIAKIKTAYKYLKPEIRGKLVSDNKKSLEFDTGSVIKARASTVNAIVSDTPDILVMDEAAKIRTSTKKSGNNKGYDLAGAIYNAAEPALNMGGKCFIISTPEGIGGFYHRMYVAAKNKINNYHLIELNWWQHPMYAVGLRKEPGKGYPQDYTSDWLEQAIKGADNYNTRILQDTFAEFLGGGSTVLDVGWLKSILIRDPIIYNLNNCLRVFREFVPGHKYVAGVDTATGDGSDFHGVEVFDSFTKEQVAEYMSKVELPTFHKHILEISSMFKPLFNIERNGIGFSTIAMLKNKKINMYTVNKRIGTDSTGSVRDLLVGIYQAIPSNNIVVNSDLLRDQMLSWIWRDGRADHEDGCHDDLLISMLLALMIMDVNRVYSIYSPNFDTTITTPSEIRKAVTDLENDLSKIMPHGINFTDAFKKAMDSGVSDKYLNDWVEIFGVPKPIGKP